MGPELMDQMRKQALRFGAEIVTDDVVSVDLTGAIKSVTVGIGHHPPGHSRHPRDGLGLPRTRPAERETALRTRRLVVCHLRRLLLPRPGHRGRRRRRLGASRRPPSSPSSPTRSPSCTAATSCAPARSWPTAPWPTTRSRFAWNSEVADVLGDDKVSGLRLRDTVDR